MTGTEHIAAETLAHAILLAQRWPRGVVCPRCGSRKCNVLDSPRFLIKCYSCRNPFSVRIGSVMAGSKIPFITWIVAYGHGAKLLGGSATAFAAYFKMSLKTAIYMRQRMEKWPEMWSRAV